jgi:hypothetical protein
MMSESNVIQFFPVKPRLVTWQVMPIPNFLMNQHFTLPMLSGGSHRAFNCSDSMLPTPSGSVIVG